MSLNLKINGFFGRNPGYFSNIYINGNLKYKINNINVNTAFISLTINKVLIGKSVIDIDFYVNNLRIRKSIIDPASTTINITCELKVKNNDEIKIDGFISGVRPVNDYEIDIASNIFIYLKTETITNAISIKNLYNALNINSNVKIANMLFNKSVSNFRNELNNINYVIGEEYTLTMPLNYSSIIYNKFVKENNLNPEIIYYLSNKIINITPFEKNTLKIYKNYINNALSQLLDCGWWCKRYCDINTFNYGQITPQYNYGSLQDATGLFVVKLMTLSLKNDFDENTLFYLKKNINYLIMMQYPNGGIPQYYPLQGGYFNNICMNDGAYLNYLKILAYYIDNLPKNFLDNSILNDLINCQKKAFDLLKQLQIKINNIPTIWAMQYDPITLEPTQARTFEPACLGSLESCQILIYLKEINFTYNNYYDAELKQVYNYGLNWFITNSINNLIQTISYDDSNTQVSLYVYKNESNVPCKLWARMCDLETSKPIYIDRQGIIYNDINLLDNERKLGYTWLGNWGEYLFEYNKK